MYVSSINNKNADINAEAKVHNDVTHFLMNGSTLEIEGYAFVDGVSSHAEDQIRQTLLLIPNLDVAAYREQLAIETANNLKVFPELVEETPELTDEEIIQLHIIELPLENCKIKEVQGTEIHELTEKDSLGGFKSSINLANIIKGKPLTEGDYNVYIRLEQLSQHNDNIKYVKTIPLANIKKFLKNNIISTHLTYHSTKEVIKYNLIASFDVYHKTLKFENILLQSFNPEELNEEDSQQEGKYVQAIKRRFFKFVYMIFNILPINKKKISFASDSRTELNGNMYFIYEELYNRNLDLKIKYIFSDTINNKKSFIKLVSMAYHFATSKVILLDDFYPMIYPLKIRRNADLIQVWHAAGAFKTFGFSRLGRPGGPSPKSPNHRNYTKATVSSEGVREHYAEGFGITEDKVFATGVPRSDIFFDQEYTEFVQNSLFERYPFIKGKKVILFAPTFRGNGQASAYYPYEKINFKALYESFHEEYVFLFKNHPFIKNKLIIPYAYSDFFYDVSDFREVNDLLLITDILITDYSSVCFEYALLNKPMLFFAFDVEEYIKERDFYYDFFDFVPGPILRTTEEIIETIKNEQFEENKIKPFVDYFFGDTLGKASRNVVDNIVIPSLESKYERIPKEKVNLTPPKSRVELFERSLQDEE